MDGLIMFDIKVLVNTYVVDKHEGFKNVYVVGWQVGFTCTSSFPDKSSWLI